MKNIFISILLLLNINYLQASTTPKIEWSQTIPYNQDSLKTLQGMQVISTFDGGCLVSVQSELSLPIFAKYSSSGVKEFFLYRPLDVHQQLFKDIRLSYTFNNHQLVEKDEEYLMYSFYHKQNIIGDVGNLGTAYVVKNSTQGIGELMLSPKDEDKLISVFAIKPLPQGNVLIVSNPTSALYNIVNETKNGFNLLPKKFNYIDSKRLFTVPLNILKGDDSTFYIFNASASSIFSPDGNALFLKIRDTSLINKIEFDRSITGELDKAFEYTDAHYSKGVFYIIGNLRENNSNTKRAFLMVVDTNKTLFNFSMFEIGTVAIGSSISNSSDQVAIVGYIETDNSKKNFFVARVNTYNYLSNSYFWTNNEESDGRLMRVAFGSNNELFVTGGSNSGCYTAKLLNDPITSVIDNTNITTPILYPNPTSEVLNLSPNIQSIYSTLELFDMYNRSVRNIQFEQYSSTVLTLDNLSQGVYTAVFKGPKGNKVEKIVLVR